MFESKVSDMDSVSTEADAGSQQFGKSISRDEIAYYPNVNRNGFHHDLKDLVRHLHSDCPTCHKPRMSYGEIVRYVKELLDRDVSRKTISRYCRAEGV